MISHGPKEPIFGLSDDDKPANVANGQIFINMDTSVVQIYSEEDDTWYPEE